jgi:hypothetical protein
MWYSLTVIIAGLLSAGLCVAQDAPAEGPPQPDPALEQAPASRSAFLAKSPLNELLEQRLAARVVELDNPPEPLDFSAGPPEALAARLDPCEQFDGSEASWLDEKQVFVYRTVCGATAWFDGFFGDRRYDQATGNTFGRITVGGYWDEQLGFDEKLRFRARFALPSLRQRGSLVIGRGDEQTLIEERDTSGNNPVAAAKPVVEDDSTYVGFAFDQMRLLSRALSFSAGLKLSGLNPYVKVRYRRAWQLSERDLLRFRPVVYWRGDEGLGATLAFDVDHVLSNQFLVRWSNFGNISEDEEIEGVNWGSTLFLFQALSKRRALTYSVFASGETDAEVTFRTAGFETRYRQRIYKEWLFIEVGGGVSWPRTLLTEKREPVIGGGLRFEAYFGPAPDSWMN